MPRIGGRRRSGEYRSVHILIRLDLYEALVLRSIRENTSLTELINNAIEAFLQKDTSPHVQTNTITQGQKDTSQAPPGLDFSDNPWINILRNKGGSE